MFLLLKAVPWCGRSGETSAEFFPCSWLPPTTHTHTAPSWLLSMRLKTSIYFTVSCSPIWRPTATVFLETSEGAGVASPTTVPGLCWGFFPNNPLGNGSFSLADGYTSRVKQFVGVGSWSLGLRGWAGGPAASASHHTRFDILVGDLLMVIGSSTSRVHRGRRHGVEREDKLLSVTHAG